MTNLDLNRVREWCRYQEPLWGDVRATVLRLVQSHQERCRAQAGEGLALEVVTERFIRYVLCDEYGNIGMDLLHPTIEAARAHHLDGYAAGEEPPAAILRIDCDLEYVADAVPAQAEPPDPQMQLFTEA